MLLPEGALNLAQAVLHGTIAKDIEYRGGWIEKRCQIDISIYKHDPMGAKTGTSTLRRQFPHHSKLKR